jgi:hypothetical protein
MCTPRGIEYSVGSAECHLLSGRRAQFLDEVLDHEKIVRSAADGLLDRLSSVVMTHEDMRRSSW